MRIPMTLAVAALAITAVAAQNPSPKDFVAKWEITGTGPDSNKIYFLDVVDKGDHLEAKFLDRSAHATPVPWIKVENGELVWQKGNSSDTLPQPSCGPVYHAKLEGGKLVGHHEEPGSSGYSSADAGAPCPARGAGAGGAAGAGRAAGAGAGARAGNDQLTTPEQQAANMAAMRAAAPPAPPKEPRPPHTVNWTAVKQPIFKPSNANGNHTYGKPMTIVGAGVGKETWSGLTPATWQNECVDRWTVDANGLKNTVGGQGEKPTCNIYTKDKWQDFKAEMDFALDTGQNSGFYVRGRHELQLALPNPGGRGGESSYPGQLMDIYGWKRADSPVANGPGENQHLEVIVVGNHVTAMFNGKKVHDNAVLYAWTGGALDNKEDQPGPIMIQGDHSRVTVKKLVVTPITKPGM